MQLTFFVGIGDFLKDDLPKADLYILARILHDLSDEKLHKLLNKLSKTCMPGKNILSAHLTIIIQLCKISINSNSLHQVLTYSWFSKWINFFGINLHTITFINKAKMWDEGRMIHRSLRDISLTLVRYWTKIEIQNLDLGTLAKKKSPRKPGNLFLKQYKTFCH